MIVKTTKQAIKDVLKPHMESKGIGIPQLAKMIGKPKPTVYRWFKGEHDMGFNTLIEICDALGLSVNIGQSIKIEV